MALGDPYVTPEDYSEAANRSGSADDELLLENLIAASRICDRELECIDGAFADGGVQTLTFDGYGEPQLWLRNRTGRALFVRDITSIGVDTERDGTFDGYTLTLADTWVRGLPETAELTGEPYTSLELVPLAGALLTSWPKGRAMVQVTCTLGWAEVPAAIREVVISMTRDLRDHHQMGAQSNFQRIDDGDVRLTDQTWRLIRSAKEQYSRRVPVFG